MFRKDEKLFLITAMDLDLPQKRIEMEAGSSRKLQLPFASSSSSSSSSGFLFSNQSLTLLQPSETREHEEQTQRECREWNRERSLLFEHWIWVRGRIRTSEADHQRERDRE